MPLTAEIPCSVEEYLRTSYDPDCDFVDGQILERNVGKQRHSHAQGNAYWWFRIHAARGCRPYIEQRIRVSPTRFRIPDVLLMFAPPPDADVFTTPPYLCLEVMSPDDTMSTLQDRIDDYLSIGVANIWVVDPWKLRAWTVTAQGWHSVTDGHLHTADGELALPVSELILTEDSY